jgi:hypothetical protein
MLLTLILSHVLAHECEILSYVTEWEIRDVDHYFINETFSSFFRAPRPGIVRRLPKNVYRATGTYNYSNISVTDYFFRVVDEEDSLMLRIGDPESVLSGPQDFTVAYEVNVIDGGNDLFLNLIGYSWEMTVSDVRFTVNFPSSLDLSRIVFYSGGRGSLGNDLKCEYAVIDRSLSVINFYTYIYM